jgi:hypothetical protein
LKKDSAGSTGRPGANKKHSAQVIDAVSRTNAHSAACGIT